MIEKRFRSSDITVVLTVLATAQLGCSGDVPGGDSSSGGSLVSTGGSVSGSGGAPPSTGGAPSTGGTSALPGSGGVGTGGASPGGTGSGGQQSAGGVSSATGGATIGSGGSASDSCSHDCVEQCSEWGGTEQVGVCEGGELCCEGATVPPENPLAHLAPSAIEVGLLLAERFDSRPLSFNSMGEGLPGDAYKSACEWYGALGIAKHTGSDQLLASLVQKFDPFKANFLSEMKGGEAHVDRYIFGMVPLEIYLQTGDESYLPLGTETADTQQTTDQTRDAIDDMFMMTGLQIEAYRATGDEKYIDFMAQTMAQYLGAQQENGLFFHNLTQARTHWGRGNGWFAAGMAEIMREFPDEPSEDGSVYHKIEEGYRKMMAGLLPYQSENGLWYQVIDMPSDPNNWEETSGSAMFTYAMVAGVRRGVLDAATYVPVIEKAWEGILGRIDAQGDVSSICIGTWYQSSPQAYMSLSRLTGDGHGQAPVLWTAAELLR